MAKLIVGFVVGVCVSVVVGYVLGYFWIYPQVVHEAYSLGQFDEALDIGYKIPGALGADIDPNERMEPFLGGKMESVVIVTRKGVKTLRLCCDESRPKPNPSDLTNR